jgi:hypothetical protein
VTSVVIRIYLRYYGRKGKSELRGGTPKERENTQYQKMNRIIHREKGIKHVPGVPAQGAGELGNSPTPAFQESSACQDNSSTHA